MGGDSENNIDARGSWTFVDAVCLEGDDGTCEGDRGDDVKSRGCVNDDRRRRGEVKMRFSPLRNHKSNWEVVPDEFLQI